MKGLLLRLPVMSRTFSILRVLLNCKNTEERSLVDGQQLLGDRRLMQEKMLIARCISLAAPAAQALNAGTVPRIER